jgi:hypothetical protein
MSGQGMIRGLWVLAVVEPVGGVEAKFVWTDTWNNNVGFSFRDAELKPDLQLLILISTCPCMRNCALYTGYFSNLESEDCFVSATAGGESSQ